MRTLKINHISTRKARVESLFMLNRSWGRKESGEGKFPSAHVLKSDYVVLPGSSHLQIVMIANMLTTITKHLLDDEKNELIQLATATFVERCSPTSKGSSEDISDVW